jgi:aspartate 1-decarboxylase
MVLKTYLTAKLHRIRVTDAQVDYIGSVGIDVAFMEVAGIGVDEQVQIVNLDNGKRWWTYAIPADRGSGTMALNGGGAYLGKPGDKLVVMAYGMSPEPVRAKVLFFGAGNIVLQVGQTERQGTIHPDLLEEASDD